MLPSVSTWTSTHPALANWASRFLFLRPLQQVNKINAEPIREHCFLIVEIAVFVSSLNLGRHQMARTSAFWAT